ncbi:MAG TPA: hypothetical protein O0X74_03790 [Methanocorpusculum sp.]|jgi:hypothetical protein|nr:hypothetical protein [Methanocorpusculum sp.]
MYGVFKVDGMYRIRCGVYDTVSAATAEAVYLEEDGEGEFVVIKL